VQSEGSFRRTWDKTEYAAKAKAKDDEERERMMENEELLKKGTSYGEERRYTQPNPPLP
jgi:U4/U6.U5 tri-snRNP component SNU23